MTNRITSRHWAGRLVATISLFASAIWSGPCWGQEVGPAGDFSLPDVNPNSSLFETDVSPRDYLGQVSGWYFGHGT
jgi:hypothetical protein